MKPQELDPLAIFPKPTSSERPIPAEIWPDLSGVRQAKVITWKPDQKHWEKFWKLAVRFPLVSIDLETEGLRPFHGQRFVGVAASFFDGKEIQAGYWNFRHRGHDSHSFCQKHTDELKAVNESKSSESIIEKGKLLKRISRCELCLKKPCKGYIEEYPKLDLKELTSMVPVLESCIIAGQNLKFDMKFWSRDGLPIPERVLDTMLIAHLYDENLRVYNLASLGKEMNEEKLGDTVKAYAEEHCINMETSGHSEIPCSIEAPYAVRDTVLVLKRLQFERDRWLTLQDHKLMEVFQIENSMSPIFARIESNGMKLDRKYIENGISILKSEMVEIENNIYKEAGSKFDIMSMDGLWKVLEARGLKPLSFTAKGNKPSLTDFDLGQYKDELCDLVKTYRVRNKMLGTYFEPFLEKHIDENDLLHSDFFIHGTVSGRASCTNPNLQNMTKFERFGTLARSGSIAQAIRQGTVEKKEDEQANLEVRRCFIPRGEDYSFLIIDFGQMELRVFAEYANEKFMLQALADGLDVHAETAKKVFVDFPKKEDDEKLYGYFRTLAKQISFGILYGMGVNKLSTQLDIPVDECVRAIGMVQAAAEEGYDIKKVTQLTLDELKRIRADHELMTTTRQWSGLKTLGKEVSMKINLEPLAEFLFGNPEMKAKHRRLTSSARTFLTEYHKQFPTIKQFTKGIDKVIASRGYIFNKYGRRYHLTSDRAYVGINRLVQGSSADMVKIAQWRIDRLLRGRKSVMMNQVHDEVQIDLHHSELDLVPKIKECMTFYPNLNVKMEVDISYSHKAWSAKSSWVDEAEFLKSLQEHKDDKRLSIKGKSKVSSKSMGKSRGTNKTRATARV